ncbi:MAG: hypothetical protein QW255_05310 [Candidatus Bilamarchaeaceae archaeon]
MLYQKETLNVQTESNSSCFYVQKNKPLTNIVFITDDISLLEYADIFKYTGIYISKKAFQDISAIKDISKFLFIIEKVCESYIICLDNSEEDLLNILINNLSLYIVLLPKASAVNYLKSRKIMSGL